MICSTTHIRGWRVTWYFALHGYHQERIYTHMQRLGASSSVLSRIKRNMQRNSMNTGFTYSNRLAAESIVVVGRSQSGAEFINSFAHELRHLCDDIADAYSYPTAGEAVAYLTGEAAMSVAPLVCQLACNHCRTHLKPTP